MIYLHCVHTCVSQLHLLHLENYNSINLQHLMMHFRINFLCFMSQFAARFSRVEKPQTTMLSTFVLVYFISFPRRFTSVIKHFFTFVIFLYFYVMFMFYVPVSAALVLTLKCCFCSVAYCSLIERK